MAEAAAEGTAEKPAAPGAWTRFFDRPAPNFCLRLALMFAGMALIAFSVAVSRATDLGTTTISCIPAVLSFATPLTIGTWTLIVNTGFVAVQVALLRREFRPAQLLALAFVFVFAGLIDFFVPIGAAIPMPNYAVRLALNLGCCLLTALGVWLQSKAALIMLPGDGIVASIAHVARKPFGTCKLAFDLTCMAVGAALSLATMGGLYGVREGTVLATLLVGPVIRLYERLMPHFERFAPTRGHLTLIPVD